MATTKPRLSIILEPEQFALVKRFAKAAGVRSSATAITQMLAPIWPLLATTVDTIEAANRLKADQLERLAGALDSAESDFRSRQLELSGLLESLNDAANGRT